MNVFIANCTLKKYCANDGVSCENCVRNKNILLPTDNFISKVTYVDFIDKTVVMREGKGFSKEDTE